MNQMMGSAGAEGGEGGGLFDQLGGLSEGGALGKMFGKQGAQPPYCFSIRSRLSAGD